MQLSHIEHAVSQHYASEGLLTRILNGLRSAGIDPQQLQADDLAMVDEFHIGGRLSTAYAVGKMPLHAQQHILDIGCGIGGASRYIANEIGCRVTGIDLTPEYIDTAIKLTEMIGLQNKVTFEIASALEMPFHDGVFDAAITLHVAMNIALRNALYHEIARVMKPGATLCIFDIMKKNNAPLTFPVPWAQSEDTSHLTTADEMHVLLDEAGFEIQEVEDRTQFALDFFQQLQDSFKQPQPLGLHLIMGASAKEKLQNVAYNLQQQCIVPVQMLAVRR